MRLWQTSGLVRQLRTLQFTVDRHVYPSELELTPVLLHEVHDKRIFLSEEVIRGTICLTKCPSDIGLTSLQDPRAPLIQHQLDIDDFIQIGDIPGEWKSKSLEAARKEVIDKVNEWAESQRRRIIRVRALYESDKVWATLSIGALDECKNNLDHLEREIDERQARYHCCHQCWYSPNISFILLCFSTFAEV